ncbi:MAG: TOBE domain-containing protein, partial [Hyphomicrobiaceae bacterium]
ALGRAQDGRIGVEAFGHRAVVRCTNGGSPQSAINICVRAGDLALDDHAADALAGRIKRLIYQGGHFRADVALDASPDHCLTLNLAEPTPLNVGDAIRVALRDGWLVPHEG